jgi:hypothetical protein
MDAKEFRDTIAKRFFYSKGYLVYYGVIIVANILEILLIVRPWKPECCKPSEISYPRNPEYLFDVFVSLDVFITFSLFLEIGLRLLWRRMEFFYGPGKASNVFDLAVALACLVTCVMLFTHGETSMEQASVALAVTVRILVRMIRLLAAVRHWQVVRKLRRNKMKIRFTHSIIGSAESSGRSSRSASDDSVSSFLDDDAMYGGSSYKDVEQLCCGFVTDIAELNNSTPRPKEASVEGGTGGLEEVGPEQKRGQRKEKKQGGVADVRHEGKRTKKHNSKTPFNSETPHAREGAETVDSENGRATEDRLSEALLASSNRSMPALEGEYDIDDVGSIKPHRRRELSAHAAL